jgi:predicted nucleotidyltransferase
VYDSKEILVKVKKLVKSTEPKATIILYGSVARGDSTKNSDIDLLILIDKEKISIEEEKKIKYPLYDVEFDTGQIISPLVILKKDWLNKHKITPFYENILKEGIVL